MRIFFVTNNYTPYSGGVISSITATSDALRAQGHEVFIVTLNFLGTQHTDPDFVIRVQCPIRFLYKKNHMAIPLMPTRAISQLLQKYKPDIVHIHHPFLLGVSALRAAHYYNIPCVFTYHTIYENFADYIPIPHFCTKLFIRLTVQRFCSAIHHIIVPSKAVKEYVQQQKISANTSVIPSPIRSFFINKENKKTSPVATTNKAYFELLLVSRFALEKNIPFVFEVFQKLPSFIQLTLVGYGPDYEKIKTYAFETLHLCQSRVQFIHKPSPEYLLQIYRNADVFIFTSLIDTQGLVLAEAMSQGLYLLQKIRPYIKNLLTAHLKQQKNIFPINVLRNLFRYIAQLLSHILTPFLCPIFYFVPNGDPY